MIKKDQFVNLIEKYHLNGIVETVKWTVKDKILTIKFISPNQDMIGEIQYPFEIENVELGIYSTSQLLKLISILDKDLILTIEKEGKIPTKLKIEDSNYTLFYSLADTSIIQSVPTVNEPQYDIDFKLTSDIARLFEKAKNALGSNVKETFTIQSFYKESSPHVKITLGEPNSYSNKIEFFAEANFNGIPNEPLTFSSSYFKEILNNNKDKEGICYISEQGLMYIKYNDVFYYLTKLEN